MSTHVDRESIEPHEGHAGQIYRQKVWVTVPVDALVEKNGDDIEIKKALLDTEQLTFRQCLFLEDTCGQEIWDQLPKEG